MVIQCSTAQKSTALTNTLHLRHTHTHTYIHTYAHTSKHTCGVDLDFRQVNQACPCSLRNVQRVSRRPWPVGSGQRGSCGVVRLW